MRKEYKEVITAFYQALNKPQKKKKKTQNRFMKYKKKK